MAALRRGFPTWCENAAKGFRRELGLAEHAALDPRRLASHLGISIWRPQDIPGLAPEVVHHLLRVDPSSWSAVTLMVANRTVIISNDAHTSVRQASNLAHELAHIILKHEPTQAFVSADGKMMMREYNKIYEDEAGCLSGTLLVPRGALLHLLSKGSDDQEVADYFGVSIDLLRMRKNRTGVALQLNRRVARGT